MNTLIVQADKRQTFALLSKDFKYTVKKTTSITHTEVYWYDILVNFLFVINL